MAVFKSLDELRSVQANYEHAEYRLVKTYFLVMALVAIGMLLAEYFGHPILASLCAGLFFILAVAMFYHCKIKQRSLGILCSSCNANLGSAQYRDEVASSGSCPKCGNKLIQAAMPDNIG